MTKKRVLIFCDFDGTIARSDVGYQMFHHFSNGKNEALIPDWISGRLSSRDILRREAAMVNSGPEEISAFLDSMEIDHGFESFVRLCQSNRITPVILSEGLEFYIRHLLKPFGLDNLPVIANRGVMENSGLRVEFPFHNKICTRCGSCKGERIDEFRAKTGNPSTVVFVGDGYSDACAAGKADLLLAKKDLAVYCRDKKIEYTLYEDFFDVSEVLIKAGLLTS